MKSEDRKAQIINVTLLIIGESGLQGLTTAKIAARSEITEAAIYRHFENKEDILQQVVETIGKRLKSTLLSVKAEPLDAPSRLSKIFQTHLEHIQKNRGIPRIVYTSEVHLDENLRTRLFSIIEFYLQVVGELIKEAVRTGKFKPDLDINAEAMRFLSMIQFAAFRYSLSGFDKSTIDEGLILWNSYLKILLADA